MVPMSPTPHTPAPLCWQAATLQTTPFGYLLLVAGPAGIHTVTMGDTEASLLAILTTRYAQHPMPVMRGLQDGQHGQHRQHGQEHAALREWGTMLLEYLRGERTSLNAPLDLQTQGTPFQQRVWEALQAIPYGETRSYHEVAHSVDHPQASRAVGAACGANPISLIIPCHRVVRSDGRPGGYGSGIERKLALLELERRGTPSTAPVRIASNPKIAYNAR